MSAHNPSPQANAEAIAAILFPGTERGAATDFRGEGWTTSRAGLTSRLERLPSRTLDALAQALAEVGRPDDGSGPLGTLLPEAIGQAALDWLDIGDSAPLDAARPMADILAFRDILAAIARHDKALVSWASYFSDLAAFLRHYEGTEVRRGRAVPTGPCGYLCASPEEVARARSYVLASFLLGNYVAPFTSEPVSDELVALLIGHHEDPDAVIAVVSARGTADHEVLATVLGTPSPLSPGAL